MEHRQQCDVALFGVWPLDEPSTVAVHPLEVKSVKDEADRRAGVITLLNDMTIELKAHFQFFKMLRERSGGELPDDETSDGKLVRADMKAASDALSLIVRTLEKIDELQRRMARERDAAEDDEMASDGYEKAVEFFLERIEALAEEKSRQHCADASKTATE